MGRWVGGLSIVVGVVGCGTATTSSSGGGDVTGEVDTSGTGVSTDGASESTAAEPDVSPWPEGPLELVPWGEIFFVRRDATRSVLMTVNRDGSGLGPIYDGGAAPSVSADGRFLLWTLGEAAWLERDTTTPVPLSTPRGATWGPVGSTFAGVQEDDTLVVQDVSEGSILASFTGSEFVRALTWSPSGSRIAFQRGASVEIADVATGEVVSVLRPPGDVELSWAPDESALAIGSNCRVALLDVDTWVTTPLSEGFDAGPPGQVTVTWSPLGDWIGVIHHFGFNVGTLLHPDGFRDAPQMSWRTGKPRWSHDGRWVAFPRSASVDGCFDEGGCPAVSFVQPADFEQIAGADGATEFDWAPDANLVVYAHALLDEDDLLPPRLSIYDVEAREHYALSELDTADPRSDTAPAWGVLP